MLGRTLLLSVIFALVFEVTCRVEDLIRFGTPMLSPYTSQTELIVRDEHGARGRPNARFQKWVLNSVGTRGPDIEVRKGHGTLRVVTAGASETFGLYESPGREYPRQLEDSLRALLANVPCRTAAAPARVEVVNAALPGMSLPTVALDVQHRIASLSPDFILYYPTPGQYLDELPPGSVRRRGREARQEVDPRRAVYPRSVARVRSQLKTMMPTVIQTWLRRREVARVLRERPPGWQFTSVPEERVRLFEHDLRKMVATMRATGATPILATNSNAFLGDDPASKHVLHAWERFSPRATGSVILAFDSVAREIVRDVARDSSIVLADVAAFVRGSKAFADFVHFTDAGAAGDAGTVARAIVAEVERKACGPSATVSGAVPDTRHATDAGRGCRAGGSPACRRGSGTSSRTPG